MRNSRHNMPKQRTTHTGSFEAVRVRNIYEIVQDKRMTMTELDEFRAQKDHFFKIHPHSPLTPEQQQTFEGLNYFPENPALRLVVAIEEFADQEAIVMQTSTGDVREYTRYGRLRFSVDGQDVELSAFSQPR